MSTTPAPGTALRDFTVAELEALPARSSFFDTNDTPGTYYYQFVKGNDGLWRFDAQVLPHGYDSGALLETWCDPGENYVLDKVGTEPVEQDDDLTAIDQDPTPTNDHAEALAPFAAYAATIPAAESDDAILLDIGGVRVTVGDFREAARVLGGGR